MKISTEISRFSVQACSAHPLWHTERAGAWGCPQGRVPPCYFLLPLMAGFPLPTGKKNKLRVYYLSWLRNRILHNDPEVEKKQGWITVGDLEGCIHYKVGERLGPPASVGKCLEAFSVSTVAVKQASGWFALALRWCVVSIALSLERVMLTGLQRAGCLLHSTGHWEFFCCSRCDKMACC